MTDTKIPVVINLDKERHLKLTLFSMVKFKEVTGKDMLKGFNFDDMDSGDILALLWACLIHEDKNLTMEQLGNMIDLQNISLVSEAIAKAFSVSLPDNKDGDNVDPNQ